MDLPGICPIPRALGEVEDSVAADPTPDDVDLVAAYRWPIFECRPTIVRPRHLEDTPSSLNPLDSKALAEAFPTLEIIHELLGGSLQLLPLLFGKRELVAFESLGLGEGRHADLVE